MSKLTLVATALTIYFSLFHFSHSAFATFSQPEYGPAQTFSGFDYTTSITSGDIDGDGDRDLLATRLFENNVRILINDGNGNFAVSNTYDTAKWPYQVTLADMNNDGHPDIITANQGNQFGQIYGNISILLNNGDGTFAAHHDYGTGPASRSVAIADFDNDGDLDAATGNIVSDGDRPVSVSTYLNDGTGVLSYETYYPRPGTSYVTVADVNNDGLVDLATTNSSDLTASILFNQGDAHFGNEAVYIIGMAAVAPELHDVHTSSFADLDHDGDLDWVIGNRNVNKLTFLYNDGSGKFGKRMDCGAAVPQFEYINDFNNDGIADVMTVDHHSGNYNSVSILLGLQNGTYSNPVIVPMGTAAIEATVGDFNNDNQLDLATADYWYGNTVTVKLLTNLALSNLDTTSNNCALLPNITSFTPATASAGGSEFNLTIHGTNFTNYSEVYWNGSVRSTTYVSNNELIAQITAADIASPTTAQIAVRNSNDVGVSNTVEYRIVALRITTESPLPSGTVGQAYSAQLAAADGTPPYTWSVVNDLPPGLNLDGNTGVISGVPTTAGTFGFTIQVRDSTAAVTSKPFAVAPPPASGSAGTPYTQPIQIDPAPGSGGNDPGVCTIYRIVSGDLPTGLTLNEATGVVSGTPVNGGTYNFTIGCIVNSGQNNGQTVTKEFAITINNPVPAIASLDPVLTTVGGPDFVLTVNGTNFVIASTVYWNGSARSTTYDSATQLRAAIPATDIATIGAASITVVNPEPGGGISTPTIFTVRPLNPPVVAVSFPVASGLHGWFIATPVNGTVTASGLASVIALNCTGATVTNLAGLNTTQASGTLIASGDGVHDISCTAIDSTGNNGAGSGSNNTATVSIDTTKPTASTSIAPSANANGWNNTVVVVSFSGSDSLSGIDTCSTPVPLSTDGAGQSASGACTDKAGNVSASATAININIDQTKPTLNPVVSPNPVLLGGTATVTAGAADALSGLDTEGCGDVDTSNVGSKSVLCTVADKAGNVASANINYTVIYNFTGFFPPVDNPPVVNVAKVGSAIPVKFSLGSNQDLAILAAGYPVSQKITCETSAPLSDIEQTVTAGSSSLTYDVASGQYIYVWKTDKAWSNTCRQLIVRLADGTEHKVIFRFK